MASASSQVAIGRAMNGAEMLFSVGLFGGAGRRAPRERGAEAAELGCLAQGLAGNHGLPPREHRLAVPPGMRRGTFGDAFPGVQCRDAPTRQARHTCKDRRDRRPLRILRVIVQAAGMR